MNSVSSLNESTVEDAALDYLEDLGWGVAHGPDIAPDTPGAERADYGDVVLARRLQDALARLNPDLPMGALDDAFRKLIRLEGTSLAFRNRAFHHLMVDGVNVEYRDGGGVRGAQVKVIDFDDPSKNDWLAVNQFTITENRKIRRPDVVLFVNGLPLGIIELKNPVDEDATIWTAWRQLQTYKAELPSLFAMNAALMVSDGVEARVGTLTAGREWFKPWRTISGEDLADSNMPELQVMLEGVCDVGRFLSLVRDFIVFEDDGSGELAKKMAGYHQFHAVRVAVGETRRAVELQQAGRGVAEGGGRYESGQQPGGAPGDQRVGVVWHTQGSGKSLTMAFYAGAIVRDPVMENPTIVVLTDRNDLDDQLFGTFSRCRDLLRQTPIQASTRADLRQKLFVASGGVVFTTIQKFFPEEKGDTHPMLSVRRNIVVIADEAHRSQYDFIDGFARHMRDALPNASFVGFTGTPIELQDANTRAVFGNYISIYDIQRSVEDGATVPIYYESRLARLSLDEEEKPTVDPEFEEATEGEEVERKEKLKTRWAQLEAIVGTEKRLRLLAEDMVAHFEERLEVMDGKAMVVCMSRRICIDLYRELVRLRPEWHDEDDDRGKIKVVMTGSASDPGDWQPHIRNKPRREALAQRFRDASDPLNIVLVRDMWLTGFDAPSLHTMYVDKPDISVLSDEFLAEVRGMPQRNLAVELLEKLLKGEISSRMRKNVVQARSFADMLEQTIHRYQNRTIEAAYIIDELIELGKEMREAQARGESLGMNEEELAFYDALETNDSAVQVLGDDTLRTIARELVRTVRENVTIDWTLRENVRANLRRLVKRILRKHGYPPDKADSATLTVLKQAEVLSEGWAVG